MTTYIYTLISFLILDSAWILGIAKSFYDTQLSGLVTRQVNFWPVLVFYPLYVFGVYIFILSPALAQNSSLIHTFLLGALFGLCAYGAYDLTNNATIANWPVLLTVVDMTWGALGTGLASVIGVWLSRM